MAHDDIMILDSGEQVFLWMGPRCSEVEVKLSYKSAQVYIQNLRAKQPERPRKLFLTIMGKVSILLKYIEVLLRYFLLFNSKYFNFKYNVFFFNSRRANGLLDVFMVGVMSNLYLNEALKTIFFFKNEFYDFNPKT